jgi:hypothetical protein
VPRGVPVLLSVAILAGVLTAGCDVQVGDNGVSFGIAQGKATDEWVRSYTLQPGGHLDISNINGPITVEASTDGKVEVRAVREARGSSDDAARQLLADVRMTEDVAPDHVRVAVQRVGQSSSGFGRSISARFTVRVPPDLVVSVRTENGAVQLTGVHGTLTAATTNGGVTGRELSGGVTATTVNGGVLLSMHEVRKDITARTVNGGVRIELPPDVNAELSASVVNGGVNVDDALKLAGRQQDRRHVSGTLNNGGPRISADTTNGGVRIYSSGHETVVQRR